MSILAFLGYFIGKNKTLLDEYLHMIVIGTLILVVVMLIFYVRLQIKKGVIKRKATK